MTQPVKMNERAMSRFNSLEFTGYRFEIIGKKPDNVNIQQIKSDRKKQLRVQGLISDLKSYQQSEASLNAVLFTDDKRIRNSRERNLKIAKKDKNLLHQTLLEARRKALEKLLCEDINIYELELQSLGKSMYRHYK